MNQQTNQAPPLDDASVAAILDRGVRTRATLATVMALIVITVLGTGAVIGVALALPTLWPLAALAGVVVIALQLWFIRRASIRLDREGATVLLGSRRPWSSLTGIESKSRQVIVQQGSSRTTTTISEKTLVFGGASIPLSSERSSNNVAAAAYAQAAHAAATGAPLDPHAREALRACATNPGPSSFAPRLIFPAVAALAVLAASATAIVRTGPIGGSERGDAYAELSAMGLAPQQVQRVLEMERSGTPRAEAVAQIREASALHAARMAEEEASRAAEAARAAAPLDLSEASHDDIVARMTQLGFEEPRDRTYPTDGMQYQFFATRGDLSLNLWLYRFEDYRPGTPPAGATWGCRVYAQHATCVKGPEAEGVLDAIGDAAPGRDLRRALSSSGYRPRSSSLRPSVFDGIERDMVEASRGSASVVVYTHDWSGVAELPGASAALDGDHLLVMARREGEGDLSELLAQVVAPSVDE